MRIGILSLVQRLLVALWQYWEVGMVPEGHPFERDLLLSFGSNRQ